jgi:magnesium transporter
VVEAVGESDRTLPEGDATADPAIDEIAVTRCYRNGRLDTENFPVEDVSDHLAEPDTVIWVDLCAPTAAHIIKVGNELGLHALAVEDAIESHQRPKLDHYSDHAFISMYAVTISDGGRTLRLSEVDAFVTPSALVTIRRDPTFDIQHVVARWDASPDLAKHGVGFLLHGLLDVVVDGHFEAVQDLDDEVEHLEDVLFEETSDTGIQRQVFALRKNLVSLRRVVTPMREVVNSLLRRDVAVVTDPMRPYYEDVYDHVLRATEWTESLRDLVTTILETNLTIQGNRLNVITKQVTSWAAIIAVPTAITGFYGQNVPYPGFARMSGFLWSCTLIIVLSSILYVTFKRREWL